jgi:hypothetical protein
VTPATAHLTLLYLCANFLPTKPAAHEVADGVEFLPAHVIEFQQDEIRLAAVNARVIAQVSDNPLDGLGFRGALATIHVGDVPRSVFDVPVLLRCLLTEFALGS